ncbi:hypothetical protein Rs2_30500 [Raphanus sativus]|nr:hypothetical protein Rs2_30500 [Raphanus sativus]
MMAPQDVIFLSVLIATISIVASTERCQYTIYVQTGTRKNSGTDSIIGVIFAEKVVYIEFKDLASWGETRDRDYFENGNLDVFNVTGRCLPNPICFMRLSTDGSGNKPGWYVEYVKVEMSKIGTPSTHQFTVKQWLALSEKPYQLYAARDDCPSVTQSLESMNP